LQHLADLLESIESFLIFIFFFIYQILHMMTISHSLRIGSKEDPQ